MNLESINIDRSSNNSNLNFEQLAQKTENKVTTAQLTAIKNYLENTNNASFLDNKLQKKGLNPYVVLNFNETNLDFNVEYYGPGNARIRYEADFASGKNKVSSKLVDLYRGRCLAKSKLILSDQDEATDYRIKQGKPPYASVNTTMEKVLAEATRVKLLEDHDGVLQIEEIQQYSKTLNGITVHKAAIITELQTGNLNKIVISKKSEPEKRQITRSLILLITQLHVNHKVAHNDLKGANILWTQKRDFYQLKLIDMDYSRPLNSLDRYHCGTPKHNSPEMLLSILSKKKPATNIEVYNVAKDAYALGITLLYDVWGVEPKWFTHLRWRHKRKEDSYRWSVADMATPFKDLKVDHIPPDVQKLILGFLDPSVTHRLTPEKAWDTIQLAT